MITVPFGTNPLMSDETRAAWGIMIDEVAQAMLEDGIFRQLMPPVPLPNDELDGAIPLAFED